MLNLFILFLSIGQYCYSIPNPKCNNAIAPDFSSINNVCYMFVNKARTFTYAETYCKSKNGHVASVNDAFTDMFLSVQAHQHFPTHNDFWIGGKVMNYSSNNIWVWTKYNSIMLYDNWNAANIKSLSGLCSSVVINTAYWEPKECNETKPFVCEVPGVVSICESGWTYFNKTDMCYKQFKNDNLNFTTIEANCASVGGHLASIHSEEENEFLSEFTGSSNTVIFVVVGLAADSAGNLSWTDNTPVDFINWEYPSNHKSICSALMPNGNGNHAYKTKWAATSCLKTNYEYICKKSPSTTPYYTD